MEISYENWRKLASDCDNRGQDKNELSKSELKVLLRRQERLIENRKFMNSLPDKGKKIFDLREKLQQMIANKVAVEETSSFLAKLSLKETIDPKHPTLTVKKEDKERTSIEADMEADDERYDLYAVAIAETYKADLADSISERFVLNKPNTKEENKKMDSDVPHLKSVKYYDDTALKPMPVGRAVKALSVTESLQLGEETKKKEQRLQQQKLMHKFGFTQEIKRFQSNLKIRDEKDENGDSSSEMNDINEDSD